MISNPLEHFEFKRKSLVKLDNFEGDTQLVSPIKDRREKSSDC